VKTKLRETFKLFQLLIPLPNIVQAQKPIIIRGPLSAQQPLQPTHRPSTAQAPRRTIILIPSSALQPLAQLSILSLVL
jgi:hypothetical protein